MRLLVALLCVGTTLLGTSAPAAAQWDWGYGSWGSGWSGGYAPPAGYAWPRYASWRSPTYSPPRSPRWEPARGLRLSPLTRAQGCSTGDPLDWLAWGC